MARSAGTLRWFNETKGFGFIDGDDGTEYYVDYGSIPQFMRLNQGDRLEFDIVRRGPDGFAARNVVRVSKGS